MPLLGKKKLSVDESAKTKRWSFGRKKKSSRGDDLSAPPSPLTPTAPTTNTSPFPPASPSPVNQHLNPNPYVLDQPPTPTTLSPPSATQQLSPPPSAGLYPPSSYIAQSRKSSTASGGGSLDGSGDGQAGGYSSPYRQPSPVERTSNSPAPSTSSNLGGYGHAYRKSYSGSPSPSLTTPYDPRQNPYIRHRDNGYNSNTGYTAGTLYGESRDDSFSGAQQNGNGPQQEQLLMRQEEQEAETETSAKPYSPYGVNILSASYEPQNQQSQLLLREEEEEKAKRTTNPYINYNTNRLSARYGTGRYSLDATRYGSSLYNPYGDDAFRRAQEEEEEEDVEAIKQEIRFVKQETVSSTRNAIRAGMMAEEAGRDTLMRLGQQGERLADAEKNLDLAHSKNRTAADQAREIKTLNRSMFAVHVKNPFNSKERQEERERTILERHDADMAAREATRAFGYQSSQTARLATKNNPMATTTASSAYRARMSLAEKAKYQFEPDESDEEKEREIEENLGQIGQIAGRLKDLAVTTGQELDRQNEQIGKIAGKNDKISRDVVLNTARLNRIAK